MAKATAAKATAAKTTAAKTTAAKTTAKTTAAKATAAKTTAAKTTAAKAKAAATQAAGAKPASARPFILVLAGVNGAGKSSVGGARLAASGLDWFNPDAYARELTAQSGLDLAQANARAWEFGRAHLEAAIRQRSNYAFETTLGGNTIPALLAKAARTHDVAVLFCGLATPEQHLARVALRVAHGGHPISEAKIRERWVASRANLIGLLPLLKRLQVFDNSAQARPGTAIADPVLLLDMADGEVLAPDRGDAAALRAIPAWAQPIVEAAFEIAGR
jgi:predicted ABC-type ATPase